MRLDSYKLRVPGDANHSGGALTSVGEDLLIITGAGELFLYAADGLRRLSVAPPDNGLPQYRAAAEMPENAGLQHAFTTIRYNSLLYLEAEARQWLYVSYTEFQAANQCYGTAIARLDTTALGSDATRWQTSPSDWNVIFRTQPCLTMKRSMRAIEGHMAGGRLAHDVANNRLLLASGDYHWDGVYHDVVLSQDDTADYGKVIAMGFDGADPWHLSKGHRNTQGIVVDDQGRIWVAEHGPRGGDELNLIVEGSNFGWPLATLGTRYNGPPWTTARQYGRHNEFSGPIYSWVPSVGVSNLTRVHGMDESWDGDLLVASLAGKTLYRLRVIEGRVQFAEPIPLGERIRYVHQHTEGTLAVWTDSRDLILLTRAPADLTADLMSRFIEKQALGQAREETLRNALDGCLECHSLRPESGRAAPALAGVHGRPIASSQFASYSPGLRAIKGVWNPKSLRAYLSDPHAFAPGTTMPKQLWEPQVIEDIILVLEGLNSIE